MCRGEFAELQAACKSKKTSLLAEDNCIIFSADLSVARSKMPKFNRKSQSDLNFSALQFWPVSELNFSWVV
jgi:hypothetical protein